MNIPTLKYAGIAPGLPFHAALVASDHTGFTIRPHDHDFAEIMLVLDGSGIHDLNGHRLPLEPGQMWTLVPTDAHSIYANPGRSLTYVNIAYPVETWDKFIALAGIQQPPTLTTFDPSSLTGVLRAFQDALAAFAAQPSDLDLLEFFVVVGRGIKPQVHADVGPAWLQIATQRMRQEANLMVGLPRLLEFCSVSPAHLSRVVRQVHGVTPTHLVNRLRLDYAKALLAVTLEDADLIAYRCGFNNVPYFYRLFRKSVGVTPREYRRSIRRQVAP